MHLKQRNSNPLASDVRDMGQLGLLGRDFLSVAFGRLELLAFSTLSKSVVMMKRDSQVPNSYRETSRPHSQARVSANTDILLLAHETPNEET